MSGQAEKPVPERIGKYDIVGVLGRGGMGVVYRGRDPRIGRDVAIKTLTGDFAGESEMLKRFYQEAGHTGNLRHPNIITVYDFGDEAGSPYIVMEFLDGNPLDKVIHEDQSMHLGAKLDIIAQVCAALSYAHRQGMIHRDVKPANVFVQRDGLVKLLDFGIARAGQQTLDQGMTRTGAVIGTPAYISPERLRGELFDGRSDIFAAGVVLYQLLTGALPFDAEYPAILHQILNEPPPPLSRYLSSYPPQLDQVIARALAKEPLDRYPVADEMAADLNAVGARLRVQHVAELIAEARSAAEGQDYLHARSLLGQVLRMDGQNADAKELMAGIDRYFNQQKVRERIAQLRKAAEDALEARNWDQAKQVSAEGLQLEPGNNEMAELLARANTGKQTREQIQKLLREAESARHSHKFQSARDLAGKALDLDPADSRIMAICNVLEHEVEEDRKRSQMRKLLQAAQDDLSASRLAEASRALGDAEALTSSDPELLRLKDELAEAIRREERKRLVSTLQDKAAVALTFEQVQTARAEVAEALEKMPAEAALLRLKLELDPRLREHENKRLIAQATEECAKLAPADALARIREALVRLPGNAELLKLESAIAQRMSREQRERVLTEYMAKARVLLEDHLYLETVRVLEQCQLEGFSSTEISELLNVARSAAAERVSQDLVERSLLEAKRLIEEQNFEAVLRLLPPVLQRVEEPALRRLLEEATQQQEALEQRVEEVVAETGRLCEVGLYDAAVGLIRAESSGVRQAKRTQGALASTVAALESETSRLESIGAVYAALNGAECAAAYRSIAPGSAASVSMSGTAEIETRLGTRVGLLADRQLTRSIEAARQALSSDDAAIAEDALQGATAWQAAANPTLQAEWKAVEAEVAAAKKVLRFRKVRNR